MNPCESRKKVPNSNQKFVPMLPRIRKSAHPRHFPANAIPSPSTRPPLVSAEPPPAEEASPPGPWFLQDALDFPPAKGACTFGLCPNVWVGLSWERGKDGLCQYWITDPEGVALKTNLEPGALERVSVFSPRSPLTCPWSERAQIHIPLDAHSFVWAHPVLETRAASSWLAVCEGPGRDASQGKGPQICRQLEGGAEAIGGDYCRLQMPLRLALGVRGTVAGRRRGGGGGAGSIPPPLHCIPGAGLSCGNEMLSVVVVSLGTAWAPRSQVSGDLRPLVAYLKVTPADHFAMCWGNRTFLKNEFVPLWGVGLGWLKASLGRQPTVGVAFPARPDGAQRTPGVQSQGPAGLLTAPQTPAVVLAGGRCRRACVYMCMPLCVGGGGGVAQPLAPPLVGAGPRVAGKCVPGAPGPRVLLNNSASPGGGGGRSDTPSFSGAFGASQFRPQNLLGASNNSVSPEEGGGVPPQPPHWTPPTLKENSARPWQAGEPDAKPAEGDVGLGSQPPRHQDKLPNRSTTARRHGKAVVRSTTDARSALFDCLRHMWCCHVGWVWLPAAWALLWADVGAPGRRECFPALGGRTGSSVSSED